MSETALTEDWPLIEVSPEKADGKAVYIIKAVDGKRVPAISLVLRPQDAVRVRQALRAGFAGVWDEGWNAGADDQKRWGRAFEEDWTGPTPNPYD